MRDLAALLEACKAAGLTIATAESCTGGLLSAALTESAGASAVFERGFITYTWDAKVESLGVLRSDLERLGAVDETIAAQMAKGALAHSNARLALATTGVAGPGPSEGKPEGRVCFALATENHCRTVTLDFGAIGRSNVRVCAVDYALGMVQTYLEGSRRVT